MMTMMKTLRLIIGSLLLVGVLVSGFVYQAEYKYFIDLAVVIIAMNVLPHPKLTFRWLPANQLQSSYIGKK